MDVTRVNIQCIGYEIAADFYEGTSAQMLLVLPGFTSSKHRYEQLVRSIVEKTGTSALVIDYSGHGESPFDIQDITLSENFSEVVRAYDWIKEQHPKKYVDVLGTSYGGYFAAKLASVRKVRKLLLRAPASYDPKDHYTPWKRFDKEQGSVAYRANPKNFEAHPVLAPGPAISDEVFVLTHEFDQSCPKTCTEPYINAFHAETWEAKGFKHGIGESEFTNEQMEEYRQKIVDWLLK